MLRACIWILGLVWAAGAYGATKDTPPAVYAWPAQPDAALIQKANATKTQSGLVVLEKRCKLSIESYLTSKPGVRRDEFIRLLVVGEKGIHRAFLDVNDDKDAKIESIEARTVAPDGRVTLADPKNDIHKTDIGSLDNKDIFASVATVNFPAPAKGCLFRLAGQRVHAVVGGVPEGLRPRMQGVHEQRRPRLEGGGEDRRPREPAP